ncbi:MAG: hypothetical protein AB7P76_12415 [Candidatus Melainabacteria bacterium]
MHSRRSVRRGVAAMLATGLLMAPVLPVLAASFGDGWDARPLKNPAPNAGILPTDQEAEAQLQPIRPFVEALETRLQVTPDAGATLVARLNRIQGVVLGDQQFSDAGALLHKLAELFPEEAEVMRQALFADMMRLRQGLAAKPPAAIQPAPVAKAQTREEPRPAKQLPAVAKKPAAEKAAKTATAQPKVLPAYKPLPELASAPAPAVKPVAQKAAPLKPAALPKKAEILEPPVALSMVDETPAASVARKTPDAKTRPTRKTASRKKKAEPEKAYALPPLSTPEPETASATPDANLTPMNPAPPPAAALAYSAPATVTSVAPVQPTQPARPAQPASSAVPAQPALDAKEAATRQWLRDNGFSEELIETATGGRNAGADPHAPAAKPGAAETGRQQLALNGPLMGSPVTPGMMIPESLPPEAPPSAVNPYTPYPENAYPAYAPYDVQTRQVQPPHTGQSMAQAQAGGAAAATVKALGNLAMLAGVLAGNHFLNKKWGGGAAQPGDAYSNAYPRYYAPPAYGMNPYGYGNGYPANYGVMPVYPVPYGASGLVNPATGNLYPAAPYGYGAYAAPQAYGPPMGLYPPGY